MPSFYSHGGHAMPGTTYDGGYGDGYGGTYGGDHAGAYGDTYRGAKGGTKSHRQSNYRGKKANYQPNYQPNYGAIGERVPYAQDLSASAPTFQPHDYGYISDAAYTRGPHTDPRHPSVHPQDPSAFAADYYANEYFGTLPGGASIAKIDSLQSGNKNNLVKQMSEMDLQEAERVKKPQALRADAPCFVPGAYQHRTVSAELAGKI